MPNLREIDFYSWENTSKEDLERTYPQEYKAWKSGDPDGLVVDGRLPLHETWSRANEVWKEIRQQKSSLQSKNVLLVCHGTLAQALLGSAFGLDATTFRKNVFSNCAMAEIVWHHDEDVAESWRWHNIL
eukprot:14199456-Ditylum_brightwellii.AAC.1